jgi:hypothetical protein
MSEDWDHKSEDLLKEWKQKASGYRWLHDHARIHYKRASDLLSYPSIIIASITGVGGFAVINPTSDAQLPEHVRVFQVLFATLNVLGGVLNSIAKFSQSSSLAEKHSEMSTAWSKLYRAIDMELSLDPKHREKDNITDLVRQFRQEYDRLLDQGLDLPTCSILAYQTKFKDDQRAKPDVVNGLSPVIKQASEKTIADLVAKWKNALSRAPSTEVSSPLAPQL